MSNQLTARFRVIALGLIKEVGGTEDEKTIAKMLPFVRKMYYKATTTEQIQMRKDWDDLGI